MFVGRLAILGVFGLSLVILPCDFTFSHAAAKKLFEEAQEIACLRLALWLRVSSAGGFSNLHRFATTKYIAGADQRITIKALLHLLRRHIPCVPGTGAPHRFVSNFKPGRGQAANLARLVEPKTACI